MSRGHHGGPRSMSWTESCSFQIHFESRSLWGPTVGKGSWVVVGGSWLGSGPWRVGPTSSVAPCGVSSLLLPAPQDDPQRAHRAALWQRWLLRGTGLDFVCAHVLHRESGLPLPPSPCVGARDEPLPHDGSASALLSSRCALCGQQPWAPTAWGAQLPGSISSST